MTKIAGSGFISQIRIRAKMSWIRNTDFHISDMYGSTKKNKTTNIPPPPSLLLLDPGWKKNLDPDSKIPDPQHCDQSPLFTLLVGAGLARGDSGLEPQQAEDESAAPIL
jgi:hypothetical protein